MRRRSTPAMIHLPPKAMAIVAFVAFLALA